MRRQQSDTHEGVQDGREEAGDAQAPETETAAQATEEKACQEDG
jgi:hypothetical protein